MEASAVQRATGRARRWWLWPALVVGAIAVIAAGLAAGRMLNDVSATDHTYVVPAGTGSRIDAGEDVEIVPQKLQLRRGDSLTVTNNDDRLHEIGVFGVRPGETVTYRFPNPGRFQGACSVHSGGTVTITIT
jgi:plastocyanin